MLQIKRAFNLFYFIVFWKCEKKNPTDLNSNLKKISEL